MCLVENQRIDQSALREIFRRIESCGTTPNDGDISMRLPAYHIGHLIPYLPFPFPTALSVDEIIPGVGPGVVVEFAHFACTAPA